MANADNLPAFEGAQGFGAMADGGRGGEVVKVTNLNDSGTGSLRWALEELEQPRIVVFDVGGTIDLKDQIEINGDVTVAGQTAPGGITVTGGRLRVVESDVIIRGMHVRPGDGSDGDSPGNRDGISVGKRGATVENVMIDSNSITWSVDEIAATWGSPSGVTFSNNIMAEALRDSIHPEGEHSMGLLIGDGSSKVSVVGNLFAHNMYRNATVKDDAKQIEFVNNVVYNYGPNGFLAHEGTTAHVIGNVYIPGADSAGRAPIRLESPESSTAYYLDDNVGEVDGAAMSHVVNDYVFSPRTTDVLPSSKVVEHVLSNVGARAQGLDAADARIIETVRDRSGSMIDSPSEVGGYPESGRRSAPADSDDDGIPDEYESIIGSNPGRADAQDDADGDGYANIEDYINGLIDGFQFVDDQNSSSSDQAVEDASQGDPEPEAGARDELQASPDDGGSTTDEIIFVEAETLELSPGFSVESLGDASGGSLIRATEDGQQKAAMTFGGASGIYDVTVGYFDENDGASTLALNVNGTEVASWSWDQDLGHANANHETLTSNVIEGIQIDAGDVVTLTGTRNGSEPLRIDSLEFQWKSGAGSSAPEPAAAAEAISLEAEQFDLDGFRVDQLGDASGGGVIRENGDGAHRAATSFDGEAGVYDILIRYFDENDGAANLSVAVNGRTVDEWAWDQDLGDRLANSQTATVRTIENVEISRGDSVVLSGADHGSEPLRIDAIEFVPDDLFIA